MINVNKEFGHPIDNSMNVTDKYKNHRKNSIDYSYCKNSIKICICKLYPPLNYENLCKNCLKTFTPEEIDEIKYYFIKKKLGIKV